MVDSDTASRNFDLKSNHTTFNHKIYQAHSTHNYIIIFQSKKGVNLLQYEQASFPELQIDHLDLDLEWILLG